MEAETKSFTKGTLIGLALSLPLWAIIFAGIATIAGCTTPAYEVCDTPNCGDNVAIIVTDK